MALLQDGPTSVGSEPSHETPPAVNPGIVAEDAATRSELDYELMMTEALNVDLIMTTARLHRYEAEHIAATAGRLIASDEEKDKVAAEGYRSQANIHRQVYQGQVAKLGELGVAEGDIPKASLKYSPKPKEEGKGSTLPLAA